MQIAPLALILALSLMACVADSGDPFGLDDPADADDPTPDADEALDTSPDAVDPEGDDLDAGGLADTDGIVDSGAEDGGAEDGGADDDEADTDNPMDDLSWVPPCEAEPCPIVIEGFPFQDIRDTRGAASRFDRYACAPNTNEAGPEITYVFKIDEPGVLLMGVRDGANVDIDLHLLDALDPDACLDRDDESVGRPLSPGVYFIAADSFVNGAGQPLPGEYEIGVHFIADNGPCGMARGAIPRIGNDDLLPMPATGPIVLEAHLVTSEEHEENIDSGMMLFPDGWPDAIDDGIERHYELSERVSGFSTDRDQPWAPCCEPSNEFGQGSSARPPAIAEAWYINMRWRQRPALGERYLVVNPFNGQAVVGAAGYENGPGDLSRVGGACEEIHAHLGTRHLDDMTFGVALDQSLPYGPIDCAP